MFQIIYAYHFQSDTDFIFFDTTIWIKNHNLYAKNMLQIYLVYLCISSFYVFSKQNVKPLWDRTTFIPYLPPIGTKIPLLIQNALNERLKYEDKMRSSHKHGHKTYSWTPIDFTYLDTRKWSILRNGTFGDDVFPYPPSRVFDLKAEWAKRVCDLVPIPHKLPTSRFARFGIEGFHIKTHS